MSGLKQSIVIVSEFTFKTKSGGGSRGATPGAYAFDYMARGDATEALTPVKLHEADGLTARYDAREAAVTGAGDIGELKSEFRRSQESAGVAFGYGRTSLSHDALVAACEDIQRQFDAGKTVFKTVLSFDGEYLKSMGVVPEDFEHAKKGDYRGQIDQMKLRMAVMSGLDNLADRGFDDMQYVGALQVDTHHAHCHLAMVDRGEGRVINRTTGAQRGKLSQDDFDAVRQGVDAYLSQHVFVKHLSPAVYSDERNVQCYVKNYAHEAMRERGLPQFLIACLPEDRSMWRAGNASPAMKKANAIMRDYVQGILDRPDSGFRGVTDEIAARLEARAELQGMTREQYARSYRAERKAFVDDCMNSAYQVLRQVPQEELNVRTRVLDRMSMDYEAMAVESHEDDADGMSRFGFRFRSYAGRQDFHRRETVKYHESLKAYESQENIAPAARAVIDFMRFEEEYNAMLLAKYQHFISFLSSEDEYAQDLRRVRELQERADALRRIRDDARFDSMDAERAEAFGRERYHVTGAGLRSADRDAFAARAGRAAAEFEDAGRELDFDLSLYGLALYRDEGNPDRPVYVEKDIKYPFDDVKALDLHHLTFDFGYDADISKPNLDAFIQAADRRCELFEKAAEYLNASGQGDAIGNFPVNDIRKMREMADTLRSSGRLPSAVAAYQAQAGVRRNEATTSLDTDYNEIMEDAVRRRVGMETGAADGIERT